MRRRLLPLVLLLLPGALPLSGCGQGKSDNAAAPTSTTTSTTATTNADGASADRPDAAAAVDGGAAAAPALAGRTRELGNPDDFTMILLAYSLTGASPPIDKWIEEDASVRYVAPIERDPARKALRQKIEAGLAAARTVGLIRLSMDANLSDFDPSYNEFTIRALAPSTVVYFKNFGEQASVKFDNADKAQHWVIDPKEAQHVRDRVQYASGATIELLARIIGSAPDASAGTIDTVVVSYELKSRRDGSTLARVTL